MQKRLGQSLLFTTMAIVLALIGCSISNQTIAGERVSVPNILKAETPGVINIDGDLSFDAELDRIYWNPHCTGLTNASVWEATFTNETTLFIKTNQDESGHVAAGAWWTTGFKSKEKLQLYTSKLTHLFASFRANVAIAELQWGQEWLRMALACAVQRVDGSVVYTEMDFYDSESVLHCPFGNVMFGGNVVYRGGNVVEYKIDQATLGEWTIYSLDLTGFADSAWSLRPGDALESVYVVVEVGGCVTAAVRIDDLWIAQVD